MEKIGIQKFVDSIDKLKHEGYIFHSRYYAKNPIKTSKDFFLTVGEMPDNFKFPIEELAKLKEVKNLTIFFEVDSENDKKPVEFYKSYVTELKKKGYIVMAMGYPSQKYDHPSYQIVANIAKDIGCDYFKTDYFEEIQNLNLMGMKQFIAGGKFIEEGKFKEFARNVERLKTASASFGRNIFESNNPEKRINMIVRLFKK